MKRTKQTRFSSLDEYLSFLSKSKIPSLPEQFRKSADLMANRGLAVEYDKWFKKHFGKFPKVYVKSNVQNALEIPDLKILLRKGDAFELSACLPEKVMASKDLKRGFERGYLAFTEQPVLTKELPTEDYGYPIYSFSDNIDLDNATYLETCTKLSDLDAKRAELKKASDRGRYPLKKVVTVAERMGAGGGESEGVIEMDFLDTSTGLPRTMSKPMGPEDSPLIEDSPSQFVEPGKKTGPSVKYLKTKNKDGEGGSLVVHIE